MKNDFSTQRNNKVTYISRWLFLLLRNELKLPQAEAITGNPNGVVAPKSKRRGERNNE